MPVHRTVVLAALLSSMLLGCGGGKGGDTGPAAPLVTTDVGIRLLGAGPALGATFDLSHGAELTVLSVTSIGGFASASCQENVEATRVRGICAGTVDVALPATLWRITVQHRSDVSALASITSVQCTAANRAGNSLAVACEPI